MFTGFEWEPLEFLEALGCAPEVDEDGLSYAYEVSRNSLRLLLTIWPLDREVQVSLHDVSQKEPLFHLRLVDTPGARVVDDKRGKFIEFAGANLFSGRFDPNVAAPYGFRLWADPYFKVEPYAYPT